MTEANKTKKNILSEEIKDDEVEDFELEKEDKKNKARLRTRGPYRKAHADW